MPATLPAPRPGLLDGATVFLDIDGTLLELADDPESVRADGPTRALLRACGSPGAQHLRILDQHLLRVAANPFGLQFGWCYLRSSSGACLALPCWAVAL